MIACITFVVVVGSALLGCAASSTSTEFQQAAGVKLPEGRALELQASTRVEPGKYVRAPLGDDKRRGVIVIEHQKQVELDLRGVELRGAPAGTDLDRLEGWGIVVRDCEDVTIRGGTLGGYKGCIVALNTKRLVLDDITFDGFYGMRLRSTVDAEDQSDWLYPHENDHDEWITNYGGAISLTQCEGATIRDCKGRHGQNGILLTRSNGARVHDNDFSFLSGWGLAMYRSSKALVSDNTFDYCVRGYSHDVYWRGQDSAGILMFERCCENLFAWNSATHGGDGVFLYAGQDTVQGRAFERGEPDAGGSDRNVWYENDFSFAVANAIEATFSSDNWAIRNRLDGCHQHGVWGGYSRRMVVLENSIDGTIGGAISIEHGQECAFVGNAITNNETGVELWWDEDKELVDGPYGKHRDTSSRDTLVRENRFAGNRLDLSLRDTRDVRIVANQASGSGELTFGRSAHHSPDDEALSAALRDKDGHSASCAFERSTLAGAATEPEWLRHAVDWKPELARLKANDWIARRRRETAYREGLDTIVMGEWGPWDFRSGEPRPQAQKSGGLLADVLWDAKWFAWTKELDPREKLADWRKLAAKPLAEKRVANFSDPWSRDAEIKSKTGTNHFGLIATTTFGYPESGKYRVSVLSDDGVRLSIDGKVVIDNWTWHAPTRDEATIELVRGKHDVVLEYFQIDGAWALLPSIERVP